MCKEERCVRLEQEGGSLHEGGGNCLKYFKKGGEIEKSRVKFFLKKGGANWINGWVP